MYGEMSIKIQGKQHSVQFSLYYIIFATPISRMKQISDDDDDFVTKKKPKTTSVPVDLTENKTTEKDEEDFLINAKDILSINRAVICPCCNVQVTLPKTHKPLLDAWESTKKPKAALSKRQAFCQFHRSYSEMIELGKTRKYPVLNWTLLESRIKSIYTELEKITTREKKSYFRDLSEKRYSQLGEHGARCNFA